MLFKQRISREDILSIVELIKDLVIRPSSVFGKDRVVSSARHIFIIFLTTIIVQIVKSFRFERDYFNIFDTELYNTILGILSIPLVQLIGMYLYYSLFLLGVIFVSKKLCRAVSVKALVLSILSISGIGLLLHIVSAILGLIIVLNPAWVYPPALLWVAVLTVRAISVSQEVSIRKAFVCFFIPFFVVAGILGIFSPHAISPYFLFLV